MYTTGVLGAATTTTAAIVLPNTGANHTMAIVATISLVVGVAVIIISMSILVIVTAIAHTAITLRWLMLLRNILLTRANITIVRASKIFL